MAKVMIEHDAEIQRRDNEISSLKNELKMKDKEIAALQRELNQRDNENERLRNKIDIMEPRIQAALILLEMIKNKV
jgi:septal ring factor EnvC (AmiA/AmiB activator)